MSTPPSSWNLKKVPGHLIIQGNTVSQLHCDWDILCRIHVHIYIKIFGFSPLITNPKVTFPYKKMTMGDFHWH